MVLLVQVLVSFEFFGGAECLAAFVTNERVVDVGVLFVSIPFGAIVEPFVTLQTSQNSQGFLFVGAFVLHVRSLMDQRPLLVLHQFTAVFALEQFRPAMIDFDEVIVVVEMNV